MYEAGGFHGVNRQVKAALRDWLAETGRELLRTAEAEEGTGALGLQFGLAGLLERQAKYDEAEGMYRRVLEALRRRTGRRTLNASRNTLATVNNLANLLCVDEADAVPPRACGRGGGVRAGAPGAPHGGNLAILLLSRASSTRPSRSAARFEEALGPAHPSTEALRAGQVRRGGAAAHPHTLATVGNLAILFAQQGKYDEAEPCFAARLRVRRRRSGRRTRIRSARWAIWRSCSCSRASTTRRSRCTAARSRARRRRSGRRTRTRSRHGGQSGDPALLQQGKYDEAEPLYRRALAGKEEALGPAHPSTLGTVGNLAILLDAKGDAAAAQELRAAYGLA